MGVGEVIDEEQSGFLAGRSIINNVRLILDLIDYNEYINNDSLVLFVDFYKAQMLCKHSKLSIHSKNTQYFWIWRMIYQYHWYFIQGM